MGTTRPTKDATLAPSDALFQELRQHREAVEKAAREAEDRHNYERVQAHFRQIAAATLAGAAKDATVPQGLRPVPRQEAHETAILDALRRLKFDPLRLSPYSPGKPSPAKQAARKALPNMTIAVFDKAWVRLHKSRRIIYT